MNARINWIGYKTIVRKEITRILRIWGQTIVPPAITMSLYFIIFGELIGKRIGQMHGFTYMEYIVPGLVIMSVSPTRMATWFLLFLAPSTAGISRNC